MREVGSGGAVWARSCLGGLWVVLGGGGGVSRRRAQKEKENQSGGPGRLAASSFPTGCFALLWLFLCGFISLVQGRETGEWPTDPKNANSRRHTPPASHPCFPFSTYVQTPNSTARRH